MKTTRKGFTLIELIVVIAIIGVLAAILVPAMLGWVKKSKIQAANADAKTIMTNINAGLEEIDEEGLEVSVTGWQGTLKDEKKEDKIDDWSKVVNYVKEYSDNITTSKYSAYIKDGVAVCCVAKSGKYFGTYPAGLTNKNYDTKLESNNLESAKKFAIAQYNDGRTTGKIGESDSSSD